MTHHVMVLNEADSNHPGFIRRYYATIDVFMSGQNWEWCQVDYNGKYVGNNHTPFISEIDAKADALKNLNGDEWEE